MIISGFFIAVSLALLAYWFRYTCVLILSARPARNFAAQIATANQLSFQFVQNTLELATDVGELDALCREIDRDYMVITCLMRHGAQFREVGQSFEDRMLMVDFAFLKQMFAFRHSREALREMAEIVQHFANQMGECAAAAA